MALKKDITIDEIEYKNCYINFEAILLNDKVDGTINRNVHGVLYARAFKGDSAFICYYNVDFVYDLLSQDNLWKQAYSAAKLLPELQDAEDV